MKNKACPKCRENGHDSNGDHLFLMTDESRYCCSKTEYHGDGQYYFEKVGGEEMKETQPVFTEDPESVPVASKGGTMSTDDLFSTDSGEAPYEPPVGIAELPCVDYRGIPKRFYEKYGCHMELSEVDRSIQKVHYPINTVCGDDLWKIRFVVPEKDFKLSELVNDRAGYHFMAELGTEPNVYYLPPVDRLFDYKKGFNTLTNEQEEFYKESIVKKH